MTKMKYRVFILYDALEEMLTHVYKYLPKEAIGFLSGYVYRWDDAIYSVVIRALPLRGRATKYDVIPEDGAVAEAFSKYFDKEEIDEVIVGWFHSHPGYGCFLSSTDIETQIKYFNKPYHIAVVIDPVRKEIDVFTLNESRNGYVKVPFKIIRRRGEL